MSRLNPLTWFSRTPPALPASDVVSEQKASATGSIISAQTVGRPVWTPRDYEKLSREAYILNAVSFRCAKMIASNAAMPKWKLFAKGGNLIDEHPLIDLLCRPSHMHGGRFLFEAHYTRQMLNGNGYLEFVGPENKPPLEIWSLRPDKMRVVPDRFGTVGAYQFEHAGRKVMFPVNPLDGSSRILHVYEFHPLNDWYGLSRVEPAAYGIDRNNSAAAHNKALLDNGARPSGALVFEPFIDPNGGPAISAPPEVIEKAERELERRHQGSKNAGKSMVLGAKVKWEDMSTSPKDMDFQEGKDDSARDICLAWGVPFVLCVRGDSTYNNVREAKFEMWEETILPLIDHTKDELNNSLVPQFGDGLYLEPDLDGISALEIRRETKRKSAIDLVESGIIDADEAREDLGYGPRERNVVGKIDASVLTALVELTATAGVEPLLRYLKSVGLADESLSEEQLVSRALDLLEDLDDDDSNEPSSNEENEDA